MRRRAVLSVLAAALFALLATGVAAGWTDWLDAAARAWAHGLAAPWLTEVATGLTWLGSLGVLALLGAMAVVWLARLGRWRDVALLLATMAGALLLENGLKFAFRRPRPEPFFGTDPATYSFPSGHALFSLCFYVTLASILANGHRTRATVSIVGAILLAGGIGFTRVYLGVHYPSDVLGGYLVAIAWLIAVPGALQRRLSVEASQ